MFNRLQDNISFILAIGGKEGKKSRCSNSLEEGHGQPRNEEQLTCYQIS